VDVVNESKNHWAATAIRDNPTTINEWELTDLLYKVNNASFAVFNARTELGIESYFITVLSLFILVGPLLRPNSRLCSLHNNLQ
jgi:hypothetical protein